MYRENLKGHFNIPKGDLKEINIEKSLENTQSKCSNVLPIDAPGPTIYFDPLMHHLKQVHGVNTIKIHF